LRLFSFGGHALALAALALVVFGAIECPPTLVRLGKVGIAVRPLAFATFLVWRLRIGACGVGACGFWRLRQLPNEKSLKRRGAFDSAKNR